MPRYRVWLTSYTRYTAEVEIEAPDAETAKARAFDEAQDDNWDEGEVYDWKAETPVLIEDESDDEEEGE